tara:strand:- start:79 stop:555 length:477 start_codon:yes stop_codon:yes gene_type:complete
LINIRLLKLSDYKNISNFIQLENNDFNYFKKLGWAEKQIRIQLEKKNSFSVGIYKNKSLIGFLMGEKINFDEQTSLEIYIIYISKNNRRQKYATKLLEFIEKNKKDMMISKIYLEVAENNISAIDFYKKNEFVFSNLRHNYYIQESKNISAQCYYKNL